MSLSTDRPSSLDELITQRRAKLGAVRGAGVNPFPTRFDAAESAAKVLQRCAPLAVGEHATETIRVAGRVFTRRDMGKTIFAHLNDRSGRIQIYLKKDELGDAFALFQNNVDLGDIVGAEGIPFRTRTGEITVQVKTWTLLSKALRPPPEKFHGMTDVEIRYRRREVDLFSNEDVRRRFMARRKILDALRRVLDQKEFTEVETPILQAVPSGGGRLRLKRDPLLDGDSEFPHRSFRGIFPGAGATPWRARSMFLPVP
jgi:lysyl-tRNA synthetase class 2